MTTNAKVSATKKSAKNVKVNANDLHGVVNAAGAAVGAPSGAGVTAGGSGAGLTSPAVGDRQPNRARQNGNSQIEAAVIRESWDYAKLKSALCRCFDAPEWSGAAAVRAALSGVEGMTAEMVEGAVLAAAKKSGIDLSPLPCSVSDVLALVRGRFAAAWSAVVGCSVDEINDTDIKVYDGNGNITGEIDNSGTANQIITDVLSYRYLVAAKRAAAWSAAVAMNAAVNSCHSAGVDCFAAGLTEEEAVSLAAGRIRAYYAAEREREFIAQTAQHNAKIDVAVLDVLLVDALAAGRYQLADKIRGKRRKALAVAGGRK